jgi:hypothetical protein
MDGNTLYPIESSKEPLPRYIKTPKEPILPKETHHTPTNIKGIEKETGVVKKEKSMPCGLIPGVRFFPLRLGLSFLRCYGAQ